MNARVVARVTFPSMSWLPMTSKVLPAKLRHTFCSLKLLTELSHFWIFGSITGTKPGIALNGVHIPLNYDPYTELAMGMPSPLYVGFRGTLDALGRAKASFNVPSGLPKSVPALTLFHAYVTYGPQGITFASNAAPVRLKW